MNQEIKTKWIEALKSGKYKQGREHLRAGDDFCCLGVLCDIYKNQSTEKVEWESPDRGNVYSILNHSGVLPKPVQEWAELDSENPITGDAGHSLAHLNDTGKSFLEIADLIEKNL